MASRSSNVAVRRPGRRVSYKPPVDRKSRVPLAIDMPAPKESTWRRPIATADCNHGQEVRKLLTNTIRSNGIILTRFRVRVGRWFLLRLDIVLANLRQRKGFNFSAKSLRQLGCSDMPDMHGTRLIDQDDRRKYRDQPCLHQDQTPVYLWCAKP